MHLIACLCFKGLNSFLWPIWIETAIHLLVSTFEKYFLFDFTFPTYEYRYDAIERKKPIRMAEINIDSACT